MAILKIRNKDGVMVPVPAIVGPQGPAGPSGNSGVYVGSGDMPEGYNVQIDPDGDVNLDVYVPQKGVDYFTEADKQELINTILSRVVNGSEVSY